MSRKLSIVAIVVLLIVSLSVSGCTGNRKSPMRELTVLGGTLPVKVHPEAMKDVQAALQSELEIYAEENGLDPDELTIYDLPDDRVGPILNEMRMAVHDDLLIEPDESGPTLERRRIDLWNRYGVPRVRLPKAPTDSNI